jgi:hypothetical protein
MTKSVRSREAFRGSGLVSNTAAAVRSLVRIPPFPLIIPADAEAGEPHRDRGIRDPDRLVFWLAVAILPGFDAGCPAGFARLSGLHQLRDPRLQPDACIPAGRWRHAQGHVVAARGEPRAGDHAGSPSRPRLRVRVDRNPLQQCRFAPISGLHEARLSAIIVTFEATGIRDPRFAGSRRAPIRKGRNMGKVERQRDQ